jgi:membrane protease YdiL (CAAX protease family)
VSENIDTQARCPNCDAPVLEDWRFCQECGAERPGVYDPAIEPEDDANGPEGGPPGGALVRWRPMDAVAVFLLAIVATFFVATIAATAMPPGATEAEEGVRRDTITIVSLFANQIALASFTFLWMRRLKTPAREALALGPLRARLVGVGVATGLIGVALSASVALFVTWVAEKIQGAPPEAPEQIPLEVDPSTLVLIVLGISTIMLAPFAEELFFRGMLHQSVRTKLRFLPAAIMSGAVFAVAHFEPLVMPSIFVLALALTTVYERERSLWAPIFAHATFNVVGFTASFLIGQ